MRVLIFSMPRCGTTYLQKCLQTQYKLQYLGEPYSGNCDEMYHERTSLLKTLQSYVVKITAINATRVDVREIIQQSNFDHILVMTRENLADCCASLYLTTLTKQTHYAHIPTSLPNFECPIEWVLEWKKQYKVFNEIKKWLDNTGIVYHTVTYEQIVANSPLLNIGNRLSLLKENFTDIKNTNIDYQSICDNYSQITQWIN